MEFKRPDFGFNDQLVFEESHEFDVMQGWIKFMDAVSTSPSNERIKNYIDFIH